MFLKPSQQRGLERTRLRGCTKHRCNIDVRHVVFQQRAEDVPGHMLAKTRPIVATAGKYRPPKIQILLTKCDLVKRIDLARRVALVRQQLEEVSTGGLYLDCCDE